VISLAGFAPPTGVAATLAVSKPGQTGKSSLSAAGTAARALRVSCCRPPPARAAGQHRQLACDRADLVPAAGSPLPDHRSRRGEGTHCCATGEAPLCRSFSVWRLLREDGNVVELQPGHGELSGERTATLRISSPAACVWKQAFSPKVASNLCKTKKSTE